MRRSEYDISLSILKLCWTAPRLKTEIIYKCNLNFKTFKRHSKNLIERQLLVVEFNPPFGRRFSSTGLGRDFIHAMNRAVDAYNAYEKVQHESVKQVIKQT